MTLKGKGLEIGAHKDIETESRLRGTALASRAVAALVEKPTSGKLFNGVRSFEDSTESVFGPATFLSHVEVGNLMHISSEVIERFTEEGAQKARGGKFGKGTYLALGDLGGETIGSLRSPGNVAHTLVFRGSLLVVSRDEVQKLGDYIKSLIGVEESSRIRSTIQNTPLTDLMASIDMIDAVMVLMDDDNRSAEVVVKPTAVDNLSIVDHHRIGTV